MLSTRLKSSLAYGRPTASAINKAIEEKRQAQKNRQILAKASIKDILSSLIGSDDADEDYDLKKFDPTPYYANPKAYEKLPYFYRHFMGEQIRDKTKKKWKLLTDLIQQIDSAKDSERQAFTMEQNPLDNRKIGVPPDLPFRYPSVLKSTNPDKEMVIERFPSLDSRSFGKKRLEQYQRDRNMNPYNRFLIATLVILTVLGFRKDRRVNLSGKVPVYGWDEEEKERKEEERRRENDELSLKLRDAIRRR
ncbi:DEKNAAC103944 [Brettanomyces naardenensis]|uniref:DEKNAAC103945 n=1 Tax=Brettanomyces naardenensis TaxID=13370 RepID=A0A448YPQ3_BRENA|nr:DEKNAAC103944 [Brettanomyces naardenensis]